MSYVCQIFAQFVPPSPASARLFSTSVSLFLPCKSVHSCHFSRFLILKMHSLSHFSFSKNCLRKHEGDIACKEPLLQSQG